MSAKSGTKLREAERSMEQGRDQAEPEKGQARQNRTQEPGVSGPLRSGEEVSEYRRLKRDEGLDTQEARRRVILSRENGERGSGGQERQQEGRQQEPGACSGEEGPPKAESAFWRQE